jgi:hypothetical protein
MSETVKQTKISKVMEHVRGELTGLLLVGVSPAVLRKLVEDAIRDHKRTEPGS